MIHHHQENKTEIQAQFSQFIAECRFSNRLRQATIEGYVGVFGTFTRVMPEIEAADQVTTQLITTFFHRLQTRKRTVGKQELVTGIKNSTVRSYSDKLSRFFSWLVQKNVLTQNPFEQLQLPVPIYADRKELSKGSVQKIITAISVYAHNRFLFHRDMAMVYVLLLCGVRRGELKALQVVDVDFDRGLLRVVGTTSKSKRTRFVPLHPTVQFHLRNYLRERRLKQLTTPILFVSNNRDAGLTINGLYHWVETLRERSGVRFHLHQFRHAFASNLARVNVNAVKIQQLMGHSDLRMTMSYLRSLTAEDLRVDIEKLDLENFI